MLFLNGGASQIETFDPKMDGPAESRSVTGEVKTSLPGVTFGGTFPQLANLADQLAIVHLFSHDKSDHLNAPKLVTSGGNTTQASMGPLYSRLAGVSNRSTGLPNSMLVGYWEGGKASSIVDRVDTTGTLGAGYRSFDPSGGGEVIRNMQLNVPVERLGDRRALLGALNGLHRLVDELDIFADVDKVQQQALGMLLAGAASAFDISKEDPRIIERYDTSGIRITPRAGARLAGRCTGAPPALGKQLLLARRLCEAGCRFVMVPMQEWDMHGMAGVFGIEDGFRSLGPILDRGLSAFLTDVKQRGLSNKILLIITGDFGRTPNISVVPGAGGAPGRDHWPQLSTLAFAGGGLNMGQIIGRSDRLASRPVTNPVTVQHLLATVMHTLFDIGRLRLIPGTPAEILRDLESVEPIPELF